MPVLRVVVADDDAAFRRAVVEVLAADHRFEVVAATSSGEGLAELVRSHGAHVVLLDVRMPDGGVPAARAIRLAPRNEEESPTRVVAVSAQGEVHTVVSLLREGAVGFLVKGRLGVDLANLVARCARGEVVIAVPRAAEVLRQLMEPSR